MDSRKGFTIVEVLVVVAILGILFGLLLPAVMAARESARLMQCQHNFRNVCLATQSFYSAQGHFPLGVERLPRQRVITTTWAGLIAPFLEQKAGIQVEYDSDKCICSDENRQALLIPMPIFQCPTMPPTRMVQFATGYDAAGQHEADMIMAVSGNIHPPGALGPQLQALLPKADLRTVIHEEGTQGQRIVEDGLSHTIIFVETIAPDKYVNGNLVEAADIPGGSPFLPGTSFREDLADFKTSASPDGTQKSAFSMHTAGLPVGYADGHVAVLSYETEPQVYAALLAAADGSITQQP